MWQFGLGSARSCYLSVKPNWAPLHEELRTQRRRSHGARKKDQHLLDNSVTRHTVNGTDPSTFAAARVQQTLGINSRTPLIADSYHNLFLVSKGNGTTLHWSIVAFELLKLTHSIKHLFPVRSLGIRFCTVSDMMDPSSLLTYPLPSLAPTRVRIRVDQIAKRARAGHLPILRTYIKCGLCLYLTLESNMANRRCVLIHVHAKLPELLNQASNKPTIASSLFLDRITNSVGFVSEDLGSPMYRAHHLQVLRNN
jgi:hypothetical protein